MTGPELALVCDQIDAVLTPGWRRDGAEHLSHAGDPGAERRTWYRRDGYTLMVEVTAAGITLEVSRRVYSPGGDAHIRSVSWQEPHAMLLVGVGPAVGFTVNQMVDEFDKPWSPIARRTSH